MLMPERAEKSQVLMLKLLGGFEADWGTGANVTVRSRNEKGLLAYLALSTGQSHPRDKLATLLWDRSADPQARMSLRKALASVRKALKETNDGVLQTDKDSISLAANALEVDVLRFEQLAASENPQDMEAAVSLYKGDFLEGLSLRSELFEEWSRSQRERLRELVQSALGKLVSRYVQTGASDDAIRAGSRLLFIDPLREDVHRTLMRLYAEQGRRGAALNQYARCLEMLQHELGVQPEEETQSLVEQIRQNRPLARSRESELDEHRGLEDSGSSRIPSGLDELVDDDHDRRHEVNPVRQSPRPSLETDIAETERRYLTVMVCGLVHATTAVNQLDPEELREIIIRFQNCCSDVVERFEGHVAQHTGDRLLAYFGYPRAHEYDAEQAVRAGLEIVTSIRQLALHPKLDYRARVSIASGDVVVGNSSREGAGLDETAIGEAPQHAARLQDLAESDSVIMAESTHRLVGELFECQDLGYQTVQGFIERLKVWQAVGERLVDSRFEGLHAAIELTPLIGRDEQLDLLERRWRLAKSGEGQVVLLTGEPGIGKSRLIRELRGALQEEPHTAVQFYGSPHHQNSVLSPLINHLQRAAGFTRDDSSPVKLEKLEALLGRSMENISAVAPLYAALLSIPAGDRYSSLPITPQRQKEKTLEAMEEHLAGLAHAQPLLVVFEDIQWLDPTSLEFLERIVDRCESLPILLVVTYRPDFASPWSSLSHVTTLVLNRLNRAHCEAMVSELTHGKPLPPEVLEQIAADTDGMPLFIEELTKTVLEAGVLTDAGDHYVLDGPLRSLSVPSTLQESLMARLDRLTSAKDIAQIAACIGRQFSYRLLEAVAGPTGTRLENALAQLIEAELIYCRGTPPEAICSFKHVLVQDAAHNTLLRNKRRQLHERIARVLEEQFPTMADTNPEELARHYSEAGLAEQASEYWKKAGERALQRSANMEAVRHLGMAIAELDKLGEIREHRHTEIALQIALGGALIATKGFGASETARAYRRARELCEALGDSEQLFPALYGQWLYEFAGPANLHEARQLAERIIELAEDSGDPAPLLIGHRVLGTTLMMLGELPAALTHLDRTMALYDRRTHHTLAFRYSLDPWVAGQAIGRSWCLWLMGFPDTAKEAAEAAVSRARELGHVNSIAFAQWGLGRLEELRGDAHAARQQGEAVVALAKEQGLSLWLTWGTILQGWALTEEGSPREGLRCLLDGLNAVQSTTNRAHHAYHMLLLAKAYARAGQPEEGLRVVADVAALIDQSDERMFEPELDRMKGELLLVLGGNGAEAEAESCFLRSLEIARHRQAKSWELRTALSLARLWCDGRNREKARGLLAPVYEWFTEGFETPDLQDAKAMLESLS